MGVTHVAWALYSWYRRYITGLSLIRVAWALYNWYGSYISISSASFRNVQGLVTWAAFTKVLRVYRPYTRHDSRFTSPGSGSDLFLLLTRVISLHISVNALLVSCFIPFVLWSTTKTTYRKRTRNRDTDGGKWGNESAYRSEWKMEPANLVPISPGNASSSSLEPQVNEALEIDCNNSTTTDCISPRLGTPLMNYLSICNPLPCLQMSPTIVS